MTIPETTLQARRDELARRITHRDGIEVEHHADAIDDVQALQAREIASLDLSHCREQLRAVEAALARMRTGSYGICTECDGAIQPARLRAVPWALRCRPCQEAAEQGQRHEQVEDFDVVACD